MKMIVKIRHCLPWLMHRITALENNSSQIPCTLFHTRQGRVIESKSDVEDENTQKKFLAVYPENTACFPTGSM
jgi:hypothetical protein